MPRAERAELGARGEELAALYLERKGYRVLARGYRYGHKEIDIIARDARSLVFVEVKSRSRVDGYPPFLAVNPAKQTQILRAARAYLARYPQPEGLDIRFDVVSIILSPEGNVEVEHLVDAFRPS